MLLRDPLKEEAGVLSPPDTAAFTRTPDRLRLAAVTLHKETVRRISPSGGFLCVWSERGAEEAGHLPAEEEAQGGATRSPRAKNDVEACLRCIQLLQGEVLLLLI